jgi:hypothetical protein
MSFAAAAAAAAADLRTAGRDVELHVSMLSACCRPASIACNRRVCKEELSLMYVADALCCVCTSSCVS